MEKGFVWQFTNQRKLNKKEFINYFERKVFRTIRKYNLLPKSRIFAIKRSEDLNSAVLRKVLEKKFIVKELNKPNVSCENATDVCEIILNNVLDGKLNGPLVNEGTSKPLYFLSDKEVLVYSQLNGLKGKTKKRSEKVKSLILKFQEKNQDIEQNVLRALNQIKI